MPQSNRLLKFKPGIPFNLESKLCNRYGYAVEQRVYGQFVSFRYSPKPDIIVTTSTTSTTNVQPLFPIAPTRQSELLKRCDNIVDFFPDPYNSEKAIRTRLHNMSQTLTASERQFVQDYMDDNFPTHDRKL